MLQITLIMNLISPKHSKVEIGPWIELAENFHHAHIDNPVIKRNLQDYIVREACSEVILTSTEGSKCLFKWVVGHACVISLEQSLLFSCFCYFAFGEVTSGKADKMKLEVRKWPYDSKIHWDLAQLRAFELEMRKVDEDFKVSWDHLRTGKDSASAISMCVLRWDIRSSQNKETLLTSGHLQFYLAFRFASSSFSSMTKMNPTLSASSRILTWLQQMQSDIWWRHTSSSTSAQMGIACLV